MSGVPPRAKAGAIATMVVMGGLAGGLQGCIWERFGESCGASERESLAPGQTYQGIDPRIGAGTLMAAQTGQLRWAQVDQLTTVTSTVALTDRPSWVDIPCDSQPSTFEVPIVFSLETDDDKLNFSLDLSLVLKLDGNPRTPAHFWALLPRSIFVGKGVISEAVPDPGSGTSVEVFLDLVAKSSGAGAAFSKGWIKERDENRSTIAEMTFAQ